MTILSDKTIRQKLNEDDSEFEIESLKTVEDQIQASSVELRTGPDYKHQETGNIRNPNGGENLHFQPGELFQIRTVERVTIPDNVAADVSLTKTARNNGLDIVGASIHLDPGYDDYIDLNVRNVKNDTLHLPTGAQIIKVVFRELDQSAEAVYDEDHRHYGEGGLDS